MSTSTDASPTTVASPPVSVYTRNATGLVREARLIDQVALNLGANTPLTSALAVGLFTIAAFPRMNIYAALLIPAALSIPIWITWALLAATFPKTGADYVYNSRILHPSIGFAVNLGFVFASILSCGFAAGFLPELAINPSAVDHRHRDPRRDLHLLGESFRGQRPLGGVHHLRDRHRDTRN